MFESERHRGYPSFMVGQLRGCGSRFQVGDIVACAVLLLLLVQPKLAAENVEDVMAVECVYVDRFTNEDKEQIEQIRFTGTKYRYAARMDDLGFKKQFRERRTTLFQYLESKVDESAGGARPSKGARSLTPCTTDLNALILELLECVVEPRDWSIVKGSIRSLSNIQLAWEKNELESPLKIHPQFTLVLFRDDLKNTYPSRIELRHNLGPTPSVIAVCHLSNYQPIQETGEMFPRSIQTSCGKRTLRRVVESLELWTPDEAQWQSRWSAIVESCRILDTNAIEERPHPRIRYVKPLQPSEYWAMLNAAVIGILCGVHALRTMKR